MTRPGRFELRVAHTAELEPAELVAHASLIMRRLRYRGRALRSGYVEGVAVRKDLRRRGLGAAVMEPLERIIRNAYDVGALGATDEAAAFYAGRGWLPWQGKTFTLTPTGVNRTSDDDDCIFVFPAEAGLDRTAELTCDWRNGSAW